MTTLTAGLIITLLLNPLTFQADVLMLPLRSRSEVPYEGKKTR
jgi:hypothetical protein